jgi:hypothetical protein
VAGMDGAAAIPISKSVAQHRAAVRVMNV